VGIPSFTHARAREPGSALPEGVLRSLPALSELAGVDLAAYRDSHVSERVSRAVELEAVAGVDGLVRLLAVDGPARERFRRSLAVPVTGLFRDESQFDLLGRDLLPPLLSRGGGLRAWSAGCANGLELYSLGILLDRMGALGGAILVGSDLLGANVAEAERAAYDSIAIPTRVRERCRFERRDLIGEPAPSGAWRLILCRNVAIYLAREAKEALYHKLAAALAPGGVLLLGRSEWIANPEAFGLEEAGPRAYRRQS
jgi:chemotaxis protein methyltransferase CheR